MAQVFEVKYEVHLMDPLGTTVDIIDEWFSLKYTRPVNDVGSLVLVLDGDYDRADLDVDYRVSVWRTVGGVSSIDTGTSWFIRKITKDLTDNGKFLALEAFSAIELLSRRVVAYNAGIAKTEKVMAADDMMKQIIRENFMSGSGAEARRQIDDYLTVQDDAGTGPTIEKEFPRDNVLDVLQEISAATVVGGSPVYFDVVTDNVNNLEFQTFSTLRGTDRSYPGGTNPVVVSPDYGNVSAVSWTKDWSDEVTYVYAGGTGREGARTIQTASSAERIGKSVFNYREAFLNATNSGSSFDAILTEAQAGLRKGRPRRTFDAVLADTAGTRYGQHWFLGDLVTMEFDGESVNCSVDVVNVEYSAGRETVTAKLRSEEDDVE